MWRALLLAALAGSASALGGALVVLLPRVSHRLYNTLLGFSAGIMLAAGAITLLGPALRAGSLLVIAVGLLCGAFMILLVDRIVPHVEPHFAPELDSSRKRLALLLAIAMTLHHLPEGLSIGVAFAAGEMNVGLVLVIAIAMHNIPEGLAVALPLRAAGFPRWKAVAYALLAGMAQPLSAPLGYQFVELVRDTVPFAFALAAGAMIFVASDQLIPESHQPSPSKGPSLALIAGFILVALLTGIFR